MPNDSSEQDDQQKARRPAYLSDNLVSEGGNPFALGTQPYALSTTPTDVLPGAQNVAQDQPRYPDSLLDNPALLGRGNSPVRIALVQNMQQTYGNRAMQRFLQRSAAGLDAGLQGYGAPANSIGSFAAGSTSLDGRAMPLVGTRTVQRTAGSKHGVTVQRDSPKGGTKTSKPVLDMSPEEFNSDTAAQDQLFNMATDLRARQNAWAQTLMGRNNITDGTAESILKRNDKPGFVKGVYEKCKRNGYTRIGQMDDIVRGRFNLATAQDVGILAADMMQQSEYPRKEVIAPRRPQPGGGFGYPRWHIIITDPATGLTHEWQIGTAAVTEVYEKKGVPIPPPLQAIWPKSMNNDLHDVEYDIFKGIKKKYPAVYNRYGLGAFSDKVDALSGEAGEHGNATPDLAKKIEALHKEAGDHLSALLHEFGADWFKQFFH